MATGLVEGQDRLVDVGAAPAAAVGRRPAGEEKTFRAYDPDQVLLISPVLQEWVPDGDLAHFVSDLVESGALELGAIYASYEDGRGQPPYDPRLMVKLLVYGYATGVMSSRKLEAGTYRDLALRMLCADQHPDYRSIARFRARHLDALAGLFVQALRLCKRAGLVGLGTLAVDGTKLRANASRHKAMSYERMGPKVEKLEAEIAEIEARMRALLADAEATDAAEDEQFGADRRGDELPAELARRETRRAKILEAMAALEAEAREAETERRAQMAAQGKKPRAPRDGRDPFAPKPKAQRNFTDPDSKIMKTSDGSYHQCFNGQAIVDSAAQVIVAADAFEMAADCPLLDPMLDQLADNLAAIDAPLPADAALTADAGYFSEDNVQTAGDVGLDAYIATGRFKHDEPPEPAPHGPITKGRHPQTADGAQDQDQEGPRHLREAKGDRRAGLRPDGHHPRRATATDTRQACRARPVEVRVRRAQPPQTAPQRRPGPHPQRMRASGHGARRKAALHAPAEPLAAVHGALDPRRPPASTVHQPHHR